jgi:hypothetical protein
VETLEKLSYKTFSKAKKTKRLKMGNGKWKIDVSYIRVPIPT